jgi:hypothetical protein
MARIYPREKNFFGAFRAARLDCFVATAPRDDGARLSLNSPRHCERSEAIQQPRNARQLVSGGPADCRRRTRNLD